ncbi:MAG: hypothetical protein RBJ76_06765 [Stenomitos frigidus ULC029]
MKRFILAGLTTLALCTAMVSAVTAKPLAYNLYPAASTANDRLAPSDLVTIAQRGGLKPQGIPGYLGLASAYTLGQIGAKEVVQGAVDAQLLPVAAVNDQAYLNLVEAQLQTQVRVR